MKRCAMVNSVIQAEELKKREKFGSGRFSFLFRGAKKKEGGEGGASKNQA